MGEGGAIAADIFPLLLTALYAVRRREAGQEDEALDALALLALRKTAPVFSAGALAVAGIRARSGELPNLALRARLRSNPPVRKRSYKPPCI